jgi:hypothetical protein
MSIQHPFPIQKIIRMLYLLTNKIYISVHVLFILLCMYLFTHTGVQHYFHIRWCSCRLTVTQRVLLVEQNLLTHPEHLSSPSVFSGDYTFGIFWPKDTKGVIRIRKSKKDRQHNGQKKKDKQRSTKYSTEN